TVSEDDMVDTGGSDGGSSDTTPMSLNIGGQGRAAAAQRHVLKYTNSGLVCLGDSIDSHLCYNPAVGLVVCASCGVGLPDGGESGHLQRVHGVSTSGPAAQAAIRMAVNTCRTAAGIVDDAQVAALRAPYMLVQDEPPPAIEGLVLHHDGLQCALCKYCTPLHKSQRKHAQLMHREANILHAQPRSVAIQSLFGAPSIQYIPVAVAEDRLLAPAMTVQDGGMTAGQFALASLERTLVGDGELSRDSRSGSAFGVRTGWLLLIEAIGSNTARAAVAPLDADMGAAVVLADLRSYLSEGARLTFGLTGQARKDILNASGAPGATAMFTPMQEVSTVDNYAQLAMRLVAMLACVQASEVAADASDDMDVPRLGVELGLSLSDVTLDATRNYIVAVLRRVGEAARGVVDTQQQHRFALLFSLLLDVASESGDPRKHGVDFTLSRFLMLASVGEGGVLSEPELVRHMAAPLVYLCRMTVVHAINGIRDMPKFKYTEQYMVHINIVHEVANNAFSAVMDTVPLAKAMSGDSSRVPSLLWTVRNGWPVYDSVEVSGCTVTLKMLADGVRMALESARGMLDELLHGVDHSRMVPAHITDDLQNNSPGYCFLADPANAALAATSCTVVKHMAAAGYVKCGVNGRWDWSRLRLLSWSQRAEQLLDRLLVLIHVTAGQPARGEELAVLRLCNASHTARSIVVMSGRTVALVQQYAKTRSATGQDRYILRFLHRDVGELLLKYLVLVRPVETLAAQLLHGDEAATAHQHMLFVFHGQPASGKHACFRADISISQYRHVATAFMHHHLKLADLAANDGLLDEQAGHTAHVTASVYGRSQIDLQRIDRYSAAKFQVASTRWQTLLDMKPTAAADPVARVVDVGVCMHVDAQAESRRIRELTAAHTHALQLTEITAAAAADFAGVVLRSSSKDRSHAVATLCQVTGRQDARFADLQQEAAVLMAAARQSDMLIVAPTGWGKSLVWLVPAAM
ncbi:hypothetical protein HK405_010657, partial [Cladochytrium tenue]